MSNEFYQIPIPDDIFEKMRGKTYKENCPIPREDLRYLRVLHKDIDGRTLEGELVCHKMIAETLLVIFEELYRQGYPIEKIRLIDEYDAVDEPSMADNNSSAFNFRTISHTDIISKHGLGIAVDINPLYNPYIFTVGPSGGSVSGFSGGSDLIIEPANGAPYADREKVFAYKIEDGDLCLRLFKEHGFEWGGDWTHAKDYQHFELPDETANELRRRYGLPTPD